MGFCCGASMVGTIGTLRHYNSYIHEVPILHCPICQAIEVYWKIKEDYEILADYARSDHAPEVYFSDYVDIEDIEDLFTDCVYSDAQITPYIVRSQIDQALDLLSAAKKIEDKDWELQLNTRLKVLSERLKRLQIKEV